MQTITIQIGNVERPVPMPASWNQLDAKTLHLFYATLFPMWNDEFTASAVTSVKLISMVSYLLKVDSTFLAKWEADCLKSDPENGQLIFLDELKGVMNIALGGLFEIVQDEETGNTTYSCRLNLTHNPYPRLENTTGKGKARKTTVLLCADSGLANISIYELATTFTYFEQYLGTNDEAWANKLIGALYRPQKPITRENQASEGNGDWRMPLRKHEKKVEERDRLAASLQPMAKRLILFWFASCRQAIVDRYPKVFKKGAGTGGPNYGWGGVLLAIAEGPAGLDAIADQNHSNALTWLSMKEDERVEHEAAMAAMKR